MPTHYDSSETRDPEERELALLARLPAQVAHAMRAPGFARSLTGIDAREIHTREALARLPVTRKSDLHALQAERPPLGGLNATPARNLARIYLSPGPIIDPEGRSEDWWRFARPFYAAGIRAGDIIQNCFSYHFTPAAFMMDTGAQKLGCPVIPAGTGNTEMQLQAIERLRPDAYVGTPSFLKIIIEKAIETGTDFSSLQRAAVGAEALPPSLRKWLRDHGVPVVVQFYASADLGSIAYESQTDGEVHPGMVLDEDLLLEIVRPGTSDPVATGDVGEVVITTFNADYPLVRFATGDLSAVLPGISPCGRTNQRIKGWMGRADQTTKIRGMFVHPGQIAEIVRRHPAILAARLVVTGQTGTDAMTLICEAADTSRLLSDTGLQAAIIDTVREITKLRADVRLVARGSLPNDGKVISDERSYQ